MLMKVFNKGQVVVPADVRRQMDLHAGDMVNVEFNPENQCVELRKAEACSGKLAGSLASYAAKRAFPSREEMHSAFAKGMSRET
jgi:AbrB family looped-hinge helix DNA binding protein